MDFEERQEFREFFKAALATFSDSRFAGTPLHTWALEFMEKHTPEKIVEYKRSQNAWARSHWFDIPYPDVE